MKPGGCCRSCEIAKCAKNHDPKPNDTRQQKEIFKKKQHKTCKYLVCVFHGQFVHTTHTKIVNFIMCRDKCYKIWYILSIEHLFIGKIIIHKKVVPWMMSKIDDYWRRRRL